MISSSLQTKYIDKDDEFKMWRLPETWKWMPLSDITLPVESLSPKTIFTNEFHYIDLGAIDNSLHRVLIASPIKISDAPSRARQRVQTNDTVFSCVRVYLENIGLVPEELDGHIASTAFCVLRPAEMIDANLLYRYMVWRTTIAELTKKQRGNSPPAVLDKDVRSHRFPVAPINEQVRISSKIDELFSRIEAGEKALQRARVLVERYRKSVLKAAVTGELTKDWREKNKGKIESANTLLERILKSRRQAWETAELAKMKVKGKATKDDAWKNKYVEPASPDTTDLPDLPEGWVWASAEQLSTKVVDGTHFTPTYIERGVPFLSVKDIYDGRLDFSECKYISRAEHNALALRCNPQRGDILITKSGTIGRLAVVDTDVEFSLFVSVALIKLVKLGMLPTYAEMALKYWVSTINIQQDIKGTAVKNLHLEDLRIVALHVPPLEEQGEIIEVFENQISTLNDALFGYIKNDFGTGALRQSILRTAFEGKLVPQDPSDEPASALLERIQSAALAPNADKISKRKKA